MLSAIAPEGRLAVVAEAVGLRLQHGEGRGIGLLGRGVGAARA
jgi:hypothetical protein